MSRNPFQYLLPVPPDAFVARWPLVKRVAFDLTIEGGDSYAIIAGRRCGKSSLLAALAHQLRQSDTIEAGDRQALPLLFDFKGSSLDSAEAFFALILKEVCRRVDVTARRRPADAWPATFRLDAGWFEKLAKALKISLRDFEDALGYILDQLDALGKPVRLVLLLDEVDETLAQPWTYTLFNQLRALVSSGDVKARIRLVLTGSRRFLDEVSDRGSPLWNVLKHHYLKAFNETGFQQLIARAEGFSDEVAPAIWQQSGGHPFLAQYLLHHLWESGITTADARAIARLGSRFRHERVADLEGWARAVEITGLRVYNVLATTSDWVEEQELIHTIKDPGLNVKRGLTALCYHGLAIHDEGWEHYQRRGDLFKTWFNTDSPTFFITELFREIYRAIERLPSDSDVDRNKIKDMIAEIEAEVKKGRAASSGKLEGLLKTLRQMAPDIFEVTVTTWSNPVAGVGMVLKKVADKAKENTASSV